MKPGIEITGLAALTLAACATTTGSAPVAPSSFAATPAVTATAAATPSARPTLTPTASPAPLCPPVDETSFDATQIVLGTSNIFGSGREIGPAPGGGGRGTLPPVWSLDPAGATVEITCALGLVIPIREAVVSNGADGDHLGLTDIESYEGISGIVDDTNGMFLTGVFLTDAIPGDPAPERLDFSDAEDFETLAPQIAQTFFVGDGAGRRFLVPDGATRLFLGFADAAGYRGQPGWYGNNAGYLDVTVRVNE